MAATFKHLPSCTLEAAQTRARMYQKIRGFFEAQNYLEVETPLLSQHASTELHLDSFELAGSLPRYLPTSPEYPMKRLLAAWSQPVFQICKSFRLGEQSARHNPEFTMLEWYTPEQQLSELQAQLGALLHELGLPKISQSVSYAECFLPFGLCVFTSPAEQLYHKACELELAPPKDLNRLELLDLIFSCLVEPKLGADAPVVVYDYLAEQASLAKVTTNPKGFKVAQRFELYYKGLELANAFAELSSSTEQLSRFEADNQLRLSAGKAAMPIDVHLVESLKQIPESCGVAVGLDRVLMCLLSAESIDQVLAFGFERA